MSGVKVKGNEFATNLGPGFKHTGHAFSTKEKYRGNLITITPDFYVRVSNRLHKQAKNVLADTALIQIENQKIYLPKKFAPDITFLEWHNQNLFEVNQ